MALNTNNSNLIVYLFLRFQEYIDTNMCDCQPMQCNPKKDPWKIHYLYFIGAANNKSFSQFSFLLLHF